MIEYKDYAKFENLSELSEAIEIGLDIEFILCGERYNISWRDDEPFICRCPEGETNFYTDAKSMLDKRQNKYEQILKNSWNYIYSFISDIINRMYR